MNNTINTPKIDFRILFLLGGTRSSQATITKANAVIIPFMAGIVVVLVGGIDCFDQNSDSNPQR